MGGNDDTNPCSALEEIPAPPVSTIRWVTPKRPKAVRKAYGPPATPEALKAEIKPTKKQKEEAELRAKVVQCDRCECAGKPANVIDRFGKRRVVLCESHFTERKARLAIDGVSLDWALV